MITVANHSGLSEDRYGPQAEWSRGSQDLLHRIGPQQSFRPLGRQAPGELSKYADSLYGGFARAPIISGPGQRLAQAPPRPPQSWGWIRRSAPARATRSSASARECSFICSRALPSTSRAAVSYFRRDTAVASWMACCAARRRRFGVTLRQGDLCRRLGEPPPHEPLVPALRRIGLLDQPRHPRIRPSGLILQQIKEHLVDRGLDLRHREPGLGAELRGLFVAPPRFV